MLIVHAGLQLVQPASNAIRVALLAQLGQVMAPELNARRVGGGPARPLTTIKTGGDTSVAVGFLENGDGAEQYETELDEVIQGQEMPRVREPFGSPGTLNTNGWCIDRRSHTR
jgi:hypothetical protein